MIEEDGTFSLDGDIFAKATHQYFDLFPNNGIVLLVGESGCGKTTFTAAMLSALSVNIPFIGRIPNPGDTNRLVNGDLTRDYSHIKTMRVTYLAAESYGETDDCVIANSYFEIMPPEQKNLLLTAPYDEICEGLEKFEPWVDVNDASGLDLLNPKHIKAVCDAVKESHVVVLDTLAACFSGAPFGAENDSAFMSKICVSLTKIKNASEGKLLFVLHHPAKGTHDPRGSSVLKAHADCVLSLRRKGDNLTLYVAKRRGAPDGFAVKFRRTVERSYYGNYIAFRDAPNEPPEASKALVYTDVPREEKNRLERLSDAALRVWNRLAMEPGDSMAKNEAFEIAKIVFCEIGISSSKQSARWRDVQNSFIKKGLVTFENEFFTAI